MIFKLAWRNACRSAGDYFVYVMTVIILAALLCVAHCVAAVGQRQAGFQTASLPLLIVVILVLLVGVLNRFIVAQRAQELAVYLLMGMEKSRLISLFLLELFGIGIVCCSIGILLGCGAAAILFSGQTSFAGVLPQLGASAVQTAVWFLLAQLLSAYPVYRKLSRLQIRQLFMEHRRLLPPDPEKQKDWRRRLWGSLSVYVFLLILMVIGKEEIVITAIAFIAVPLLISIYAFYQYLAAAASGLRRDCPAILLEKDRLLTLVEFTASANKDVILNSVFCACLIFAFTAFCFGTLLFTEGLVIYDPQPQRWMGFLQINIGLIFLVLYFSMLSLTQILKLRRQTRSLDILCSLGKSQTALNRWLDRQILINLGLPVLMSVVLLGSAAPVVNFELNQLIPSGMQNILFQIAGIFALCFAGLYGIYACAAIAYSRRYLQKTLRMKAG